jgi:hypothetical protein
LNILEGQLDLISNSFYKKYLLDSFQIGKVKFPKVLFGSSPFFGAGQFKERSMIYHNKFYLNPPNITQLYQESILRGLNAIHVPSDPVIIHAIAEAIGSTFIDNFVLATVEGRNLQEELNLCEWIEAQSIIIHGSFTDDMPGSLTDVLRIIKRRFNDIPTGIATHSPGNIIPKVLGINEIDIILTPINSIGEFMLPNADSTLNAIIKARETGKKIIAMKALAAGMLRPMKAFDYLVDKVDGVVVGITSTQELYELLNAGLKYFDKKG